MKRFYREARASADRAVLLDDRPVRTPSRATLVAPNAALASAIAAEWNAQGQTIAPRSMPLTGLANAAIDQIALDRARFAADLAGYAETDLLCYRAPEPVKLAERQVEMWEPLLGWARRRYDIAFTIVAGVVHHPQPATTVHRLGDAVRALDEFALAGLSPLVTIGGSLVVALAVAEAAVPAEGGFAAVEVDGDWHAERWGADALALAAREARRADFLAAARFLELLR